MGSTDSSSEARVALLSQLFVDHADSVHNVAFRILWSRADSEDIVGATFLQAFVHLDELRTTDRARPWLLRIAYRQALTVLRRRRDVPVDPDTLAHHTLGGDPSDAVIAADLAATVRGAIDALPETLRSAFVLRDVEGVPMADVADVPRRTRLIG